MGGGVCSGGVCLGRSARGGLAGGGCTPPVGRILDTRCENITFPQLRLQTVNIMTEGIMVCNIGYCRLLLFKFRGCA